jgi:hypothetical protein
MTRDKRLDIKLSPEERRALEILSVREGRTLSELARELLRSAIQARGLQVLGLIDILYSPEGHQEAKYDE